LRRHELGPARLDIAQGAGGRALHLGDGLANCASTRSFWSSGMAGHASAHRMPGSRVMTR